MSSHSMVEFRCTRVPRKMSPVRSVSYKQLYQDLLREREVMKAETERTMIRKDRAYALIRREALKNEFYYTKLKNVVERTIVAEKNLEEIERNQAKCNYGLICSLGQCGSGFSRIKKLLNSTSNLEREMVLDSCRKEILDNLINAIQKKIDRLYLDEPYASLNGDELISGAQFVLLHLIEIRDAVAGEPSAPSEDTLDHELNQDLSDLENFVAQEAAIGSIDAASLNTAH